MEKDEDDELASGALKTAEKIMEEFYQLSISNDPEKLCLSGAINKRLHKRTGEIVFFEKAIECCTVLSHRTLQNEIGSWSRYIFNHF